MAVDSCACQNLRFDDLKQIADRERLTLEQLSQRTGCCAGCGLCIPYVRVMLHTGITDLPILNEQMYRDFLAWPDRFTSGEPAGSGSGSPPAPR